MVTVVCCYHDAVISTLLRSHQQAIADKLKSLGHSANLLDVR
jgi:hypothetical protein